MGAIHKEDTITGRTLGEAFNALQELDREELGNDYYNGSWHNAQGIVEVSRHKFENEEPSKHEAAWALCIRKPVGNNMKTKTTVTNFPAKGTRKWVTRYEVKHPEWGNVIVCEEKQADAIKKARWLVEQSPDWNLKVCITKRLVSGKTIVRETKVAEINYKKSSTERDGTWDIQGCLSY